MELTAAVQGLRDQLISSVDSSNGQPIMFEVEEINLEFSVELRRDASVKAGFKAWVVSADAQAGVTHNATHKVSVKLRPKDSVSGRSVEIGSREEISMDDFDASAGGFTR
ncbi:trypco2 family protein [Streptomyces griseofuscus]|uniref:trypco2 family protein n=1 Tax=Streptomyces TaxID=1883 RepID=UPI0027DBE8A6|nr:trypco2 family protein [Streptomyces sp. CRPSP2-6A1]